MQNFLNFELIDTDNWNICAGSMQEPSAGWAGKVNGVTNPAKINGITVANIAKVNGV